MSRAVNELLPELTPFIEGLAEPRILVNLDYRILAANKAYVDAFAARIGRWPPLLRGLASLHPPL